MSSLLEKSLKVIFSAVSVHTNQFKFQNAAIQKQIDLLVLA